MNAELNRRGTRTTLTDAGSKVLPEVNSRFVIRSFAIQA